MSYAPEWHELNGLMHLIHIFRHISNDCTCSTVNEFKSSTYDFRQEADFQQCMQLIVLDREVDTACTLSYSLGQVEGNCTHCADKKGSNFAFDILVSLYLLLSHRGLIAAPVKLLLVMMGQWGLFVIRYYTPPLSHIPFSLQTSIFSWPSKTTPLLSHTGPARLVQLCIINILNIYIYIKSQYRDLGLSTLLTTTNHLSPICPAPWMLPHRLFALEAANWESISELAARRLKRTTDKDILANGDNSAARPYLFVPVSLSNLAVK